MTLTVSETLHRLVNVAPPDLRRWLVGPAGRVLAVRGIVERVGSPSRPKAKSLAAWRGDAPEKYGDYGGLDWAISQMVKAATGIDYGYPYWSSTWHNAIVELVNKPNVTIEDIAKAILRAAEWDPSKSPALSAQYAYSSSITRPLDVVYSPPDVPKLVADMVRATLNTRKPKMSLAQFVKSAQPNVVHVMGGLVDGVTRAYAAWRQRVEDAVAAVERAAAKMPEREAIATLKAFATDAAAVARAAKVDAGPVLARIDARIAEQTQKIQSVAEDVAEARRVAAQTPTMTALLEPIFEGGSPSKEVQAVRDAFKLYGWRRALAVAEGKGDPESAPTETAPTSDYTTIEEALCAFGLSNAQAEAMSVAFGAHDLDLNDIEKARPSRDVLADIFATYAVEVGYDGKKGVDLPIDEVGRLLEGNARSGAVTKLLNDAATLSEALLKKKWAEKLEADASDTLARAWRDFDAISIAFNSKSPGIREDAQRTLDAWNPYNLDIVTDQLIESGVTEPPLALVEMVASRLKKEWDYLNDIRDRIPNPRRRRPHFDRRLP